MQGSPSTWYFFLLKRHWAINTLRPRGLFPQAGSPSITKAERSKFQMPSKISRSQGWKNIGVNGNGHANSFRAKAPSEDNCRRACWTRFCGQPKMGEVDLRSSFVCQRSWARSQELLGACLAMKSKPWSKPSSSRSSKTLRLFAVGASAARSKHRRCVPPMFCKQYCKILRPTVGTCMNNGL